YHWGKRSVSGINEAIKYFNQAIGKDPKFALAYAGLADCYAVLQIYQFPPPLGGYLRARENARKALALDDSLAEAHVSLAYVEFYYDHDRAGAESSFRRAIALNPSYVTAHHWLALALVKMGRHDEALAEIKNAQQLDPRSAIIKGAAGTIYYYARQYDQALAHCRQALELDPGLVQAHRVMRWTYVALRRYDDAFAAYEKEKSFSGAMDADWSTVLAQLQAISGNVESARATLRQLAATLPVREGDFQPYEIAVDYALLGDHDQALKWLSQAAAINSYNFNFVLVEPRLDSLRSDPRFVELVKKTGLRN